MIFIPKYPIIDAVKVSDDLYTFIEQLNKLHVSYEGVTTDKRNIDGQLICGYTIQAKNKKNFVFVPFDSILFQKDNILHIIEDTDVFLEFYTQSSKEINVVSKQFANLEKFVCPVCGFISTKQFTKCPNCEATCDSCVSLQSTSKRRRSRKMTDKNVKNPNDDLAKAREEALQDEEAKEVTAVYGDSVTGVVNASINK